ncbi:MAG: aldehyde dehydrogenase family protein, partial [Myxococcota bacterium]|nr:aldehyde dehydrogenase family protein [Myxococcota bacterium]
EGESWWLEPAPSPDNPRLWSPGIKAGRPLQGGSKRVASQASGVAPGSFSHLTEFFGPVLSVLVARDLEQAMAWANATPYGLTAGLHSLDEAEQRAFIDGMNAGNLYVNRTTTGAIVRRQPFGGRKASCFGPGAKAGGPNYVRQFVEVVDAGEPGVVEAPLVPMAEHLVAKLGGRHRSTAMRYAATAEAHFFEVHDPSRVRGQDNVFRYQFHTPILLVAFSDACQEDIERAVLAMVTLGVPFQVCTTGGVDLASLRAALGPGMIHGGAWDARFKAASFGRMRAIGTVPASAYEIANQFVAHIETSPVVEDARTELQKYVVEQSVSVDFHRYGHLGLRELEGA